MTLQFVLVATCVVLIAFALEEFVLIKPVSTIADSDPLSRRLELAALWLPSLGIAFTTATLQQHGGVRLGGLVNLLGLLLCGLGLGLRYWSRRTLGQYFTIGVVAQAGHVVIEQGPYRWVRHPAYLAFIVFYLGLALLMGSTFSLLVLSLPAAVIFVWLCWVEDQRLAQKIGADYQRYIARRARLIPGIW